MGARWGAIVQNRNIVARIVRCHRSILTVFASGNTDQPYLLIL